jgi:hypothetical protein
MKANLRKKELLPLSRATWSVLHDRHYFHHHRHRPHNIKPLHSQNHSLHRKNPTVTDLSLLPICCFWVKDLPSSTQKTCSKPREAFKLQNGGPFPERRHIWKRDKLECNIRSAALTKTSSSSDDPGAREGVLPPLSHLQLSSHIDDTSRYRSDSVIADKRIRSMCDLSSYSRCRSTTDLASDSDSSLQPVSRLHLTNIQHVRNCQVAEHPVALI